MTSCPTEWGTVADWAVALSTLIVAIVAVGQEWIRGLWVHPTLKIEASTRPPNCVLVPVTNSSTGEFIANRIYLRIRVENSGNRAAKNTEVYASALRRLRGDGSWEPLSSFPPMNLRWADLGTLYWPVLAAKVSKYCDVAHITDPSRRHLVGEDVNRLGPTAYQTNMVFDLITAPNHNGHVVGPGTYQLDVLVAAENASPHKTTVQIFLEGKWENDEALMLRDAVGITVLPKS